jgi:hypothetical protein
LINYFRDDVEEPGPVVDLAGHARIVAGARERAAPRRRRRMTTPRDLFARTR